MMSPFYIIIQTYFVYLLILVVLLYGSRQAYKTGKFRYVVYAVLFYAILFGFRYGVGADSIAYLDMYKAAMRGNIDERFEIGYAWLERLFAGIPCPPTVFFGFISFVQLLLVYYSTRKHPEVFRFLAYSFVLCCVWKTFANGIRQEIAFCIFLVALNYADKKHWWLYLSIVLFASLFHNSALILLLLLPLLLINKDWFPSKKWQFILLIIAIILGRIGIVSNIIEQIETFATVFGYEHYFEDNTMWLLVQDEPDRQGIGYFVLMFLAILTILYSDVLKRYYTTDIYKLYNLYFVGVLVYYLFANSQLIGRVNAYFYGLNFIIVAYMLSALFLKNKRSYRVLLFTVVMLFIGTLYRMFENDSAFFFVGQEDLYRLLTH